VSVAVSQASLEVHPQQLQQSQENQTTTATHTHINEPHSSHNENA